MFSEIVSLRLRPGTAEEVRRLTEQRIVPWLRGRAGFHGLHMVQMGDGEMVIFNTWSSRPDASGRAEEERLIQQTLGHLLAAPLEVREGQTVVHAPGHEPVHGEETHHPMHHPID